MKLATFAFGILFISGGCATTKTQLTPIDKEQVEREKQKQRQLWMQTHLQEQQKLDNIAFPILKNGISLCDEDTTQFAGIRYANAYAFEDEWHEAAIEGLGLNDSLKLTGVVVGSGAHKAGLRPGDYIRQIGKRQITPGKDAIKQITNWFDSFGESGKNEFPIQYQRDGQLYESVIKTDKICDYPVSVVQEGGLNAFADGNTIYVTSAMMRFTSDEELTVIVAHEFAHNSMGHIDAKKKNALAGALLGALGDVTMASYGVDTGGYYTSQFASLGSQVHSQDFEREADHVGLYALALAGLPLESAPLLWRHMAMANPESIALAHSHPTSAERFVRMEQTIEEIKRKIQEGKELFPNMKE